MAHPPAHPDRRSPISEQVFLILLALVDGPSHGYGILLEVESRNGGGFRLGTGTLYSAIKRLRREGLLEETQAPAEDEDPRRRYYALTDAGRSVVRQEASRLARLADLARARRVLPA